MTGLKYLIRTTRAISTGQKKEPFQHVEASAGSTREMIVPASPLQPAQDYRPICYLRRDFLLRLFVYWFAPMASAPGFTVNAEVLTESSHHLLPEIPERPLWIRSHVRRELTRLDEFIEKGSS